MSKEVIRPESFRHISKLQAQSLDTALEPTQEQLQQMSDLYKGIFESFNPGSIIESKIISADSDGILVDIGYKSYGFVPKYEFGLHELKDFKPGQAVEVMLETLENHLGNVVVSYEKAKVYRAWNTIAKLFEENKPVEGIITHKVKGGLNVDIGVPAFLPGSQIDLHRVTDFDQFLGQKVTANILKINQKRGNVIISRRKYLSEQRADLRKKVLDTLEVGQTVQGVVKNITNYGVFVDIGGVDGLLHITDMTWGRIAHPSEVVKIGDTITVKVLSFDKEHEKISLDLKSLTPNPWEKIADKIKVGDVVKGTVSSISDYGLFVEIAPNVEGLVHISEISWTERITNPANRFSVGDKIEVKVVSLDLANHRMSLSIKQLSDNPWNKIDEIFSVGQKVKGSVSNITDFGIFVRLMPGIDGLVHISDLSWTEHVNHPSDRYRIGQEVEAVVLSMDKDNRKISLGIKQLGLDPWENVETEYPVNSIIEGTVAKIANFGAFIRLPTGIEGLLHNTILMEDQGKKAEELLKVGQTAKFRVVNVNRKDHRLGLSMNLEARGSARPAKEKEKSKAEIAEATPVRHERPERSERSMTSTESSRPEGSLQMALKSAMQAAKKDAADAEAESMSAEAKESSGEDVESAPKKSTKKSKEKINKDDKDAA